MGRHPQPARKVVDFPAGRPGRENPANPQGAAGLIFPCAALTFGFFFVFYAFFAVKIMQGCVVVKFPPSSGGGLAMPRRFNPGLSLRPLVRLGAGRLGKLVHPDPAERAVGRGSGGFAQRRRGRRAGSAERGTAEAF